MNHRDAGAFEKRSPTESQWKAEQASEVNPSSSAVEVKAVKPEKSVKGSEDSNIEEDILVVVSKVKAYIRSRSGMNTSDRVMNVLSESIRRMADDAIRSAVQHERKTVLDRDVR
jgi:histone H3/H4